MLSLVLVCVGRAKAGAERDIATRYLERAKLAGRGLGLTVDLREIPESKARRPADRKAEESQAIRIAAGDGAMFALDETGRSIGSEAFADIVRAALDGGAKSLALVVGGPDGLDPDLRDTATQVIALGAMTWPHQLVRILVAEQIYRAVTILTGHPYHRA